MGWGVMRQIWWCVPAKREMPIIANTLKKNIARARMLPSAYMLLNRVTIRLRMDGIEFRDFSGRKSLIVRMADMPLTPGINIENDVTTTKKSSQFHLSFS